MDPALIELTEAGPADEEVSLILRLQDGAEPPPTVRVVCRFGPIITVRCYRADILPTWASDRVISVKAPRAVHLPGPVGARRAPTEIDEASATEMEMDPEEAEAVAGTEPAGRPQPPPALPVDGRGVVVGICDWGLDFTHPNFRNADGSTRLLALWDQRGTGDPRAPAPYHRGRLFTPDDINAALAQPDPCAALGYHPASGDPNNTGSHGTHVSDIVAGNRRYPGSEVGLASGADLVFVHLGAQHLGELDNLGDSVGLLEGLDFVRRTAAAAGRPCVMHLSAGKTGGPHCGVTLVERAVDILLQETPGIVLVQSGGNYADTAMHTHARIGPDQTHVIDWLIPPGDRTPNELEIWYSGMDVFEVTLVAPDGQAFSAPLAQRARLGDGGDAWGNFYHRLHEPNSGLNHVAIFLYTAAPTGRWKVVVHGRDVVDGRLHAWIERDAGSRYQSRFSRAQATSSYTTNTICNSFRAIAVGAYDATRPERSPGHFSSRGPTADGRQKPELAAPGVRILAARSMPRDGWNGERRLVVKSGTSMAAPWVSGTVALMFQAAGRSLTIHEVRRILIGTADPHAGPRGRSSSQLGFGYLNTAAAVEAARRLGSGATAAPPRRAVAFSLAHDAAQEAEPGEAQPIASTWIEEPLQALSSSIESDLELVVMLTSSRDRSSVVGATVEISGRSTASATTDARGNATFTGIDPGAYMIATTHPLFLDGSGGATVHDNQSNLVSLALTPRPPVNPIITLPTPAVVLVKKPHTAPSRQQVILTISDRFDGHGTFTRSNNRVRFFTAATGGTELRFNGTDNRFTGTQLRTGGGVRVFAEGARASAAPDDVGLTLTLAGGTLPFAAPAHATLTALELELEICKSRTNAQVTAGADPSPMSAADKIAVGRFLHTQDTGGNAGRALLIVHQAVPHAFSGHLILNPSNARVRIFAAETGGAALLADHPIANGPIPATGQKFWLEGGLGAVANSAALRDTGALLGIQGVHRDGDNVRATVVTFSQIQATIHPTPPHTPRAGQPAPADHVFRSASLSEDFTVNRPLVLMRNAQPDIALAVTVSLPGLPVLWEAIRNPADHVSLGNATAVPALRAGRSVLDQIMRADARGSFRIRAYLDTNGTRTFQDREPSIPLNLVLGDVRSPADISHADPTQVTETPNGISTGTFAAGSAAMEMDLSCDVTGGGADGKLGLDRIFAGLVNNLTAARIHADYQLPPAPPAVHSIHPFTNVYVANPGAATGVFGGRPVFLPGDPAPAPLTFPLLDSGRTNAGTGGNLACMRASNVATGGATASGVGERWQITCVDAPSRVFPAVHPGFPGTRIVAIVWHQEFVANFCFWTNVNANIGATNDPAERVYSVVRIVPWTIDGRWTIAHPAAGPAAITRVAYNVTTGTRRTLIPPARAQDNGVEVRPPSGIQAPFSWNART